MGKWPPKLFEAGLGRLDDKVLVVSRYPAGTAASPLGVQAGQSHLVEGVVDLRTRSSEVWISRAITGTVERIAMKGASMRKRQPAPTP